MALLSISGEARSIVHCPYPHPPLPLPMEKPRNGMFHLRRICLFPLCFILILLLFSLYGRSGVDFFVSKYVTTINDSCSGRYIYIHDLPSRFNYDLVRNCSALTRGTDKNMCPYIDNLGLGPELVEDSGGVLSNRNWFHTNQFMLEVIFHSRLRSYDCLTSDSAQASAIFIPYYAGLDMSQFLWSPNISVRDRPGLDLLNWVSKRPEWEVMSGRDHFLVAGRIAWDFRRQTDETSDWGTKFMFLPEARNMTMLSVESSVWKNDFAVPYPTYFHPWIESDITEWQHHIRNQERPYLFSFAGAPRPEQGFTIRGEIINQCLASIGKCKLLNCSTGADNCDNPINVMRVFQKSVFCLQPRGDSYTRRSTFDSILAGCIPVFFHPGTSYVQYIWHLPKNHTKYSVYIPFGVEKIGRNVSISAILSGFSMKAAASMREEVISLIPRIVYADTRVKRVPKGFDDAFDLAIKGVLERVDRVRRVIRDGGDPSIGFSEQNHFKFDYPLMP